MSRRHKITKVVSEVDSIITGDTGKYYKLSHQIIYLTLSLIGSISDGMFLITNHQVVFM